MLFRKKGKLRKSEDEKLVAMLDDMKFQLANLRELVQKSVDPSPLVIYEMHLIEVKYLFLLREARYRQTKKSEKD